ncbi:unnamed protein product [Orchesella dallaii]|uniref:Uncharacterized protein n=1 Tax=Orchesella dallaii TaxID=48710 RepID=A0ABP1R5C1_9HEXA
MIYARPIFFHWDEAYNIPEMLVLHRVSHKKTERQKHPALASHCAQRCRRFSFTLKMSQVERENLLRLREMLMMVKKKGRWYICEQENFLLLSAFIIYRFCLPEVKCQVKT